MDRQRRPLLRARHWVLAALCGYSIVAVASGAQCPETAQQYWTAFRTAALRGDRPAIADMSRFPFAVNGMLDESAKRRLGRKQFIAAYPALLKTDPGLSATPTTMKALLDDSPKLSPAFCNPAGNQFRVGTWVFELTPQGWRFVQAFVDE